MDSIHRFLFEELDIRGALVRLGPSWAQMQANRNYPPAVRELLGQLAAITTIIGGNLKNAGRLSFQLQGQGPVAMLVMDCQPHGDELRLRGMARGEFAVKDGGSSPESMFSSARVGDLVGDGQLVLTLQNAQSTPYQSYVPLQGDTLAAVFEHYLETSEQQPARLWLAADGESACGLFLQKLPEADEKDADGWNRVVQLAATVKDGELALAPETLIGRLFSEESVRLFAPRPVHWHCPRDESKVRDLLLSLGREEVESMLADAEQIAIEDEICGHEYRFGRDIVDELFPPGGRVLH